MDSNTIDTAPKTGPRLAVALVSCIAPQSVPGVFAPNAVAAGLATDTGMLMECENVRGVAPDAGEEMGGGNIETALRDAAVDETADAEARTLGQNVLLNACTSTGVILSAPML